MAHKTLEYTVHFLVAKDGSQYSALCYEYNVATCANTPEEALQGLMEATIAYLEAFLEKRQEPKDRPASDELLLEFLDLDPRKKALSKVEVARALRSVIRITAKMQAPLVYSLDERRFDKLSRRILPRLGPGSYPVTISA
jgi:predicted RNase H-like HicB family nuclease